MINLRKLLCLTYLALTALASECPIHAKIGNAINFVRLFKEQADSDFNYQNLRTDVKLRLHQVTPKKGKGETHRIVFQADSENKPRRSWLYAIEVDYDEAEILLGEQEVGLELHEQPTLQSGRPYSTCVHDSGTSIEYFGVFHRLA